MTHTDLNRIVMYNGMICRIIGVTYSHPQYRGNRPFYSYHLMPEGKFSLKDSIQYQTFDKLAFEPPVMGSEGLLRYKSDSEAPLPTTMGEAAPYGVLSREEDGQKTFPSPAISTPYLVKA